MVVCANRRKNHRKIIHHLSYFLCFSGLFMLISAQVPLMLIGHFYANQRPRCSNSCLSERKIKSIYLRMTSFLGMVCSIGVLASAKMMDGPFKIYQAYFCHVWTTLQYTMILTNYTYLHENMTTMEAPHPLSKIKPKLDENKGNVIKKISADSWG